jgi:hypothetical protein
LDHEEVLEQEKAEHPLFHFREFLDDLFLFRDFA